MALMLTVESYSRPGVYYALTREGTAKRDGGDGARWACTCPGWTQRKARCAHMRDSWRAFAEAARTGRWRFPRASTYLYPEAVDLLALSRGETGAHPSEGRMAVQRTTPERPSAVQRVSAEARAVMERSRLGARRGIA